MTELESERLLQDFFAESRQMQLDDEAFTRRVMDHLPAGSPWFERIWTACCWLLAIGLFVVCDGWQLLVTRVEVLLRTMPTETVTLDPLWLGFAMLGLLMVGVGEAVSRA